MQGIDDLEKTTRVRSSDLRQPSDRPADTSDLIVTIFDGSSDPVQYHLRSFGKAYVTFGRSESNDIVFGSKIVSREHGRFSLSGGHWVIEDCGAYSNSPSANGLIYNNSSVTKRVLCEGDLIRIDDGVESIAEGVLMVFSSGGSDNSWSMLPISGKNEIKIGRDFSCDIVLSHISVSKLHARITYDGSAYYIADNGSTNGIVVNDRPVNGRVRLHEKDVITITNSKLIFTSTAVFYCCCKTGISVDTSKVVIQRGKGEKAFITSDNVSLNIRPGELVAVIGGSGAGKSTILNCMCGYLAPTRGNVYINGCDLYRNFDSLKKLIGYVPQSDIVYDGLTLYDMLSYTAKLRLPKDISEAERENAIKRSIELVELNEKRDSFIRDLSGGQKKRASIAVELLSDPNLLFLDEPSSGLDPGTERSLMQSLRKMADSGKTVILVTHSTLQLKLCDKIVFMGKGGKLCFAGTYSAALRFFGVSDIVDIYNMITDSAPEWQKRYNLMNSGMGDDRSAHEPVSYSKKRPKAQLPVLCSRYMKLVVNDRQRLLLLLVQAPILALLISLVADGKQFEQYEMTKSLLFALSCSGFWVGMLNAIQEVCKERNILKREYMTGLSLNAYILSKVLVLSVMCLIQSVLIVAVFWGTVGLPPEGLLTEPFAELLCTTFLTAVASTAMGLFVSSLFTNADKAMTVAPILLMPQILFSGLIFKLDGATEAISWFAVCRWSMEGYGTTADLNSLELRLQQEGVMIPHEAEDFFEHTTGHLEHSWLILILFVAAFLVLARIVLSNIDKDKS